MDVLTSAKLSRTVSVTDEAGDESILDQVRDGDFATCSDVGGAVVCSVLLAKHYCPEDWVGPGTVFLKCCVTEAPWVGGRDDVAETVAQFLVSAADRTMRFACVSRWWAPGRFP